MAASAPVSVELEGLDELADGSEKLTEKIGETAGERLYGVAQNAGGEVQAKVPRRTGRLAASVKTALAKNEKRASVRIGTRVPYAGWIEFGGTRGRPFIRQGRYLYPTALSSGREAEAKAAAERAANDEIRSFRWPKPSPW
jgi:hypothetical protein